MRIYSKMTLGRSVNIRFGSGGVFRGATVSREARLSGRSPIAASDVARAIDKVKNLDHELGEREVRTLMKSLSARFDSNRDVHTHINGAKAGQANLRANLDRQLGLQSQAPAVQCWAP